MVKNINKRYLIDDFENLKRYNSKKKFLRLTLFFGYKKIKMILKYTLKSI